MVHVEEDPEIGATIKQTLDAGFPIRVQDLLTLEILTQTPVQTNPQPSTLKSSHIVIEVWQFRIDIADRLSPNQESASVGPSGDRPDQSTELAVEDSRRSRLFEKLGTLLKSIIVATRLLPAYNFLRAKSDIDGNQSSSTTDRHQMFYTLRRGPINLSNRLGSDFKSLEVGRLFSGLAVNKAAGESANLAPVFVNTSVYYRAAPGEGLSDSPTPIDYVVDSINTTDQEDCSPRRSSVTTTTTGGSNCQSRLPRPLSDVGAVGRRLLSNTRSTSNRDGNPPNRANSRVRPAFVHKESNESEELFDPAGQMLARNDPDDDYFHEQPAYYQPPGLLEPDQEEEAPDRPTLSSSPKPVTTNHHHFDHSSCDDDHPTPPLQLPFSTLGNSGARLTKLFAQLRKGTHLDLFTNPSSSTTGQQSSLFDADALADELEHHEKILKEFDDFLIDFNNRDLAGPSPTLCLADGLPLVAGAGQLTRTDSPCKR